MAYRQAMRVMVYLWSFVRSSLSGGLWMWTRDVVEAQPGTGLEDKVLV